MSGEVFQNVGTSAPGPDGLPFEIYRRSQDILCPLFLVTVNGMIDGTVGLPDNFKLAYFVCLPKTEGKTKPDGSVSHGSKDTRPLYVADASNQIVAYIFRIGLEP